MLQVLVTDQQEAEVVEAVGDQSGLRELQLSNNLRRNKLQFNKNHDYKYYLRILIYN
jgi:hypothetical protein